MEINQYQNLVKSQNDGCNIGRLKTACQFDTPDNKERFGTARLPIADLYRAILSMQSNVGDISNCIETITFDGSSDYHHEIIKNNLSDILYHLTEIANALDISLEDIINASNTQNPGTSTQNEKKTPQKYHCEDCVHYDDKHMSCLSDDCPHSKVYICYPSDEACENFELN